MARRLAIIATLAVVSTLLIGRPVAAAEVATDLPNGHSWLQGFPTTIHDFHWSRLNGGRWVDDRCGTSQQRFRIILYAHKDFRGNSVVLCHGSTHGKGTRLGATFCEVPLGVLSNVSNAASCNLSGLFKQRTANDKISSIRVVALGRTRCLRLFEHSDHKGRSLVIDGDVRSLHQYRVGGSHMGDRISSVVRSSEAWRCAWAVGD